MGSEVGLGMNYLRSSLPRSYRRTHSCARKKNCVVHEAPIETNSEEEFEIIRCPNKLELRESYGECNGTIPAKEDVYRVTSSDNDVGLSIEDRRFIEIMENGIHKNAQGNWEMPLPFRSNNVSMPNNRSYAFRRLKALLQRSSPPRRPNTPR